MVELGLTPFEAIRTATRYPAEFLSASNDFGTIAAGQRADLILVNGNPLANLANVQRRVGVMVHGDWRTEAQLQKMLKEIPDAYARSERFLRDLLTSDPPRAFRYMDDNDPFHYLALAAEAGQIAKQGIGPFKHLHREMKQTRPDAEMFAEINMNALGHRLFELGRRKEAIELFKMNADDHPQSAKACDSLAEAHLKNGDKELAIKFYRKALQSDPKSTSAVEALKKLAP